MTNIIQPVEIDGDIVVAVGQGGWGPSPGNTVVKGAGSDPHAATGPAPQTQPALPKHWARAQPVVLQALAEAAGNTQDNRANRPPSPKSAVQAARRCNGLSRPSPEVPGAAKRGGTQ